MKQFGELFTSEILPVGRFTNDSHGKPGHIRKRISTPDFYFSIFILCQRGFISRRKLIQQKYSPGVLAKLMQKSYWESRIIKSCASQSWREIWSLKNGHIYYRDLVVDNIYYYLCDGEVGPTNWRSDVYEATDSRVIIRQKNSAKQNYDLNTSAVFLGSRKDQFYFHALHWTLLKYLSIPQHLDGYNFIFHHDLNRTVKRYISESIKRDFPKSQVLILSDNEDYFTTNLSIVLLNRHSIVNNSNSETKEIFNRVLRVRPKTYQDSNQRMQRRVLICKRDSLVLLDRPSLSNWDQIIEDLSKDFLIQVIDPGMFTLEEQAYFFENTDVVIAEHGGGLANIIFMRRNSQVIEIQTSLSIDLYGEMARAHSLNYSCISIPARNREYSLDTKKLFEEIQRFQS